MSLGTGSTTCRPTLLVETRPSGTNMSVLHIGSLARTPRMNARDDIVCIGGIGRLSHHPMDGAEQFHAQRAFEAGDQILNSLEPCERFRLVTKKRKCLF